VIEDGERITERIRPSPPPALAPAQTTPSIEEVKPEESGQRAPDFGVSGADDAEPDNLVIFPAPVKASARGRPRKTGDTYRVSVEQVSKHTYAVRIRWKREDGSDDPGVVVNRLTDKIVKEIQRSKKRYEQFKAQTLISWKSGAIRKGDIPRTDTIGLV
jgi:hypothetical protein